MKQLLATNRMADTVKARACAWSGFFLGFFLYMVAADLLSWMLQVRRNLRLLRDSRHAMVPTSAKDCRKRAAECIRVMRRTRVPGAKQALREQAAFWLRLATEMERSKVVRRCGTSRQLGASAVKRSANL
jgi:hypothetical protein